MSVNTQMEDTSVEKARRLLSILAMIENSPDVTSLISVEKDDISLFFLSIIKEQGGLIKRIAITQAQNQILTTLAAAQKEVDELRSLVDDYSKRPSVRGDSHDTQRKT